MPSISATESKSLITSENLKKFIKKCKESCDNENLKEIWENDLKFEARRLFNLLPLKVYEDFVFKELKRMSSFDKTPMESMKSTSSFGKSNSGSGSLGSIGNKFRNISLIQSNSNDQLKCLELISNNSRRMKAFTEEVLDKFWSCLESSFAEANSGNEHFSTVSNIIKKLADINQRWFLSKITKIMAKDDTVLIYAASIRPKLYPEEDLEDSMNLIEKLTQMEMRSVNVCNFLACLLTNIRMNCEKEFVYPKLSKCLKSITDKFSPYYLTNFKISEDHMKLLCAALCLSGKEGFLERFDEVVGIILQRIREKSFTNDALLNLNEILITYYNRYPDAWATILDRTESIFIQIFPQGRKNVLGCDDELGVGRIVKILETVSKKLPRFSFNEIIKKMIKQCSHGNSNQENFPWDRANITLQTFLYLASINTSDNINNNIEIVWKEEYSKVRIGDLELEPMSKEVTELIKSAFSKISKQYWMPHLNSFVFDLNKTKLLAFIVMILEKFGTLMDFCLIIKLTETNVQVIEDLALKLLKNRMLENNCEDDYTNNVSHVLVHKIGNIIFGQSFKIFEDEITSICDESKQVFKFFKESFDKNCKFTPVLPINLQENPVLRGGIFHILESLTAWSQIRLVAESTRLNVKEIELFGKVVDVYFRLSAKYETLVKTVYLEKQSDKNIILRSWSSLVGFKRNSKEISDFLVSILDFSDEKLRLRMIQSLSLLPQSRSNEFMKLFEKFRLAVSEDFVNLKRSRRNDKSKIEITRVYKNILISWQDHEVSNLTPLRMILRHVIELYYFVSKNEVVDNFIWNLRGEFCGLLSEFLKIINLMSAGTRRSFLPQKFHLEVWLTVDEWVQVPESVLIEDYSEVIDGLFSNFSFNLLSAVLEVDKTSLSTFTDNLLIKISRISSENVKSMYVYNLLKSAADEEEIIGLLFMKLIEFVGSGRDFGFGIQEGIKKYLDEDLSVVDDVELEPKSDDNDVLVAKVGNNLQNIKLKGPALELFKLMRRDSEDHSVTVSDPQGVLEMFNLVSDAKLQRRILNKLRLNPSSPLHDEKIIKILFQLSGKLIETFPNSLRELWQSIIIVIKDVDKDNKENSDTITPRVNDNVSIILHFLIQKIQSDDGEDDFEVIRFVYKSLLEVKRDVVESLIFRYSHPFTGTRCLNFKISPLEAILKLTMNDEFDCLRVARLLSKGDLITSKEKDESIFHGLLKWATECPIKSISSSAWMNLKGNCSTFSSDFVLEMVSSARRFLKYLVCPTTFKYFDCQFVTEILNIFAIIMRSNQNLEVKAKEDIFEFALIQLSATDEIVYEAACNLISSVVDVDEELLIITPTITLSEFLRRPSISINLLFKILNLNGKGNDFDYKIEEYFDYLIAVLPFIFRYFEENLNVSTTAISSANNNNSETCAELEYLKILIKMNQKIIIQESENEAICLMDLNEFLISIKKRKRRPGIDFYKTFALLLSDSSVNTFTMKKILMNLDFTREFEIFVIHFLDSLRIQRKQNICKQDRLRIANLLAESESDCDDLDLGIWEIRQRVIDYLIK